MKKENRGLLTQPGRFFLSRARHGGGLFALLQRGRQPFRGFRLERLLDAPRVLLRVTAQTSGCPVVFLFQVDRSIRRSGARDDEPQIMVQFIPVRSSTSEGLLRHDMM